ncbi:MAG: AMP-binding protein [Desulfobacterales bacterium]|nr:AMP-binding protein [Desulfobacterales bacterium]
MLLHHEFVKTAKKQGDKIAFIDRGIDRKFSYNEALTDVLCFAEQFKQYKDAYLGIMLPTSAACGLSMIAAHMSAKVPVMINYATGAEKNCEYAQYKVGFKTILTSKALLEKIRCPLIKGMIFIEDILADISIKEYDETARRAALPADKILATLPAGSDDDTLLILFTSGSEAQPKAVEMTHKNIGSNLRAMANHLSYTEDDIFLALLPYFHIFGQTCTFWMPIILGSTIVTYPNPLDFKTVCKIIREEKCTTAFGTPAFLIGYLKQSKTGDFVSLKKLVAGADKTTRWMEEEYLNKHHIEILGGYGATETSPVVSCNRLGRNKPGSIGEVLAGVQVKIISPETGEEMPRGEQGKILVKGDLIMKGYLGDPEITAQRIQDGWYDTADIGILDEDGYLWHKGRLKRFVKIGGEMISLVNIENEIEKFLPEGVSCCVVELPHAIKGAEIAVAVSAPVNEKLIISRLKNRLHNLAIPKKFIVIGELPRMGNGKIDFKTTTEIAQKLNAQQS